MFYADLRSAGYASLRHHDDSFDVQYRLVSFGTRMGGPDKGFGSGFDDFGQLQGERDDWGNEETHGDILNWGMWQVNKGTATGLGTAVATGAGGGTASGKTRTIPGWAQAWAVKSINPIPAPDDSGTGSSTTPSTVDVNPVFNSSWSIDSRFKTKTLNMPPGIDGVPGDVIGLVVTGTNEYKQEDLFLPIMSNAIIAPHEAGNPALGTFVYDLTPDNKLDRTNRTITPRRARLQTIMRVWEIGNPKAPNRILENLCGKIGSHALAIQMGPARGKIQSRAGFADYGDDFGAFPAEIIGLGSWSASGPFHPGSGGDKHGFGDNEDGDRINSLHISTNAYFYRDKGYDAPLEFGGDWIKPKSSGDWWQTFLRYDAKAQHPHVTGMKQGMWRWETRVPVYYPKKTPGGGNDGTNPPENSITRTPEDGMTMGGFNEEGRNTGNGEDTTTGTAEDGRTTGTTGEDTGGNNGGNDGGKLPTDGPTGPVQGPKITPGSLDPPQGTDVPPNDGSGWVEPPMLPPVPGGTPEAPTEVEQPPLPPYVNPVTDNGRFTTGVRPTLKTLNEIGAPGLVLFPQPRNPIYDDHRNDDSWNNTDANAWDATVPAVVRMEAIGYENPDGSFNYFEKPGYARYGASAAGGLWIFPPNVTSTEVYDGTVPASMPTTYFGLYNAQIGFGTPTTSGKVGSGVNIRLSGSTLQGDITDANGNVTSTTQLFPVSGSYVPLGTSSGTGSLAGGTSSTTSTANQATAYGNTATATGTKSTAIGYNTLASGTGSIAIGGSASSRGTGSIAIGDPCYAPGTGQITIGYEANSINNSWSAAITIGSNAVAGPNCVVIGDSASADGTSSSSASYTTNVVIGNAAVAYTSTSGVAIGHGANTSNTKGIALGYLASAADSSAICIGANGYAQSVASISLGRESYAGATNIMAIGSPNYPVNTYYLGRGWGTQGPYTIGASTTSVVTIKNTDGSGTNIAGSDLVIEPSLATGNAASGRFSVKIGQAGASGTTLQTSSEVFGVNASGIAITGNGSITGSLTGSGTVFSINGSTGVALFKRNVAPKTASYTAVTTESEGVYTNEGASGLVPVTLPAAAAGLVYHGYVQNSNGLKLIAAGSNTIRMDGSVSGAGGYVSSTTTGSFISLIAVNASEWITMTARGTWSIV